MLRLGPATAQPITTPSWQNSGTLIAGSMMVALFGQ